MPTYTHRCPVCGEFEQVRPMAAANDPAACRATPVTRDPRHARLPRP